MLLRMGPFVPADLNVSILFHFGPDEGHQCDRAQFDWYINSSFISFLNFNNAESGLEIFQGPFHINLNDYIHGNLCAKLQFSFVCKYSTPGGGFEGCHEGAAFDFTWSTGNVKTWYINTSEPTVFTSCELSSALSDPP